MRRLTLAILVLTLLAAACGSGEGFGGTTSTPTTSPGETTLPTVPTTPPTTLPAETTTTAPPAESTTSTVPGVTTTTGAGTYYEVNTSDFFPDPFPGSSGGAHGSGCVVADYVTLPDGVWFGFVEAIGIGGVLHFDLACFFTGEAAIDAAAEDGEEAFDFYIRNKVAVTYAVPVAAGARVWYIDMLSGDVSMPTEIPLASWPSPDSFQDCPSDHCAVWLYVNGLQVTAIVEQYLP